MWRTVDEVTSSEESAMRQQILAFLDEYCRGMTLADVREWYADAVTADVPVYAEGSRP